MADAFDRLPLTFRGMAALADHRDSYSHNPFERTDIILAKVIQVNQSSRTINCVGLNMHQNEQFNDVWVMSTGASQKEGSTWLPKIDPLISRSMSTQATLENSRDVIAVLTFIENNPNIPICIGFVFPQENELSFTEPDLKIERHSSNVYERLTGKGNYEFVFPDQTFIKIAAATEPDSITNIEGMNLDKKTHPWKITKDFDRKILLSHSSKNRLRVSSDGVYIETYASSGPNFGTRTGGYGFSQDGNLVLAGSQLFIQNISPSNPADVTISGVVRADAIQLGGTAITDVITSLANGVANQVVGQYFGGGSSGGGGGTVTLSPGSIANGSISIEKLNFVPATKSEFDAHVLDFTTHALNSNIHLILGTSSTTAAAGDHTHAVYGQNGTITWGSTSSMSLVVGTTNNAGSGSISEAARIDHSHGISIASLSAAPTNISIGATNSTGTSTTAFARADHVHGTPALWTPSSHTHAYTDLLPVSNAFALTANTISLYNTGGTNALTLNTNGSVVLSGTTLDLVGAVKINGVAITGGSGSSSGGTSSSTGSTSTYYVKNTTSGAAEKNLTMDGADAFSSTNHIKISANAAFGFRADISASTSTGSAGGLWVVEGVVRRGEAIASIVLQDVRLVSSYVEPLLSACSVSVDVDAVIFGSLIFHVQGASGLTIHWTADVVMFGDSALLPVAPNAGGGSSVSGGSSSITFPAPGGSLPSVTDDADYGVYILKGSSLGTASIRLTTDGNVSTISNVPVLSDNTSWVTDITVAAHVAGVSAGVWKYSGLFRRGASAASTTFLGPLTQEEIMDTNFESAVVSIAPDTTFGGINISAVGLSGVSSSWIAVIHATELR